MLKELMVLEHRIENQMGIIFISGYLCAGEVGSTQKYMTPIVEDPSLDNIILNCKRMTLIDSTGVGYLANLKEAAQTHQKDMVLCELTEKCDNILRLIGLDKMIQIVSTEAAAILQFKK